jgi:tight adherence protein C
MLVTFAALISTALLTKLAIFIGVAAGAWWMLELMSKGKPRAEQRLDEFREPNLRRGDRSEGGVTKRPEGMSKLLAKASPKFTKHLTPTSEADVGKLRAKLNHAGFRGEASTSIFLGLKAICIVLGFLIGGGALWYTRGYSQETLMYTVGSAGLAFYLPDVVLWFFKKSRQDAIFFGLPDALDLMVVCVEAGLGLDQAMRRVADEMKKSYPVIADEFGLCNLQLQMGRRRADVLHELGQRTGVDDLRALASILIQADKFGSSVAQALRVQSESMRTRRKQIAEEKAAKTAVKLIFPLVLFIYPGIFVVLVGPAAITMIREMFPAMNGGG